MIFSFEKMETIFVDSCRQYKALFVRSKPIWDRMPIFGAGGLFWAGNRHRYVRKPRIRRLYERSYSLFVALFRSEETEKTLKFHGFASVEFRVGD